MQRGKVSIFSSEWFSMYTHNKMQTHVCHRLLYPHLSLCVRGPTTCVSYALSLEQWSQCEETTRMESHSYLWGRIQLHIWGQKTPWEQTSKSWNQHKKRFIKDRAPLSLCKGMWIQDHAGKKSKQWHLLLYRSTWKYHSCLILEQETNLINMTEFARAYTQFHEALHALHTYRGCCKWLQWEGEVKPIKILEKNTTNVCHKTCKTNFWK